LINSDLDLEAIAKRYGVDQRVRIDNFLTASAANDVLNSLAQEVAFDRIFFYQGRYHVFSDEQLEQLPPADRTALEQGLLDLAAQGIGFDYRALRMDEAHRPQAPQVLQDLFDEINSAAQLERIHRLSGVPVVTVDGQFTRYSAGSFLTRHSDRIVEERRRIAYVLNLTPHWHPDWGGLLQFFQQDGVPRDAWEPRFNSLSLFDVSHIHSVTYVTPFAAGERFALTGWYRD
jgi:Rps23 Pro-64 3,4-dihydroxylase Tpa1-like proline 4-hydroxylase